MSGTTAFPTIKWKDGNDPYAACYCTVENILEALSRTEQKPAKVVLVTSIGCERLNDFPFKILNLYGVLTEKRRSELLLMEAANTMGFTSVICRPGENRNRRRVGVAFMVTTTI